MKTTRRKVLQYIGGATACTALFPMSFSLAAPTPSTVFEPTKIGSLTIKNKLIRSATSMNMCDESGVPQQDLYDAHTALAKGGIGLITTGLTYVYKDDQFSKAGTGLYSDDLIPEYKKLTDNAHNHDTKIAVQLVLAGAFTDYNIEKRPIWGPSNVAHPVYGTTPQAMTKEDINDAVNAMAAATVRAQKAGFDGIELHFAHNFLISQFFMPYFNKRTDEYGGSIDNRARLAFEITEACRKAVGSDFPLWAKINGNDYLLSGGASEDEILFIVKGLQERGLDAINISGGNLITGPLPSRPDILNIQDQSYFKDDAKRIASKVDIPLILTGGHRTIDLMETVLADNPNIKALGISRTVLSEPDLPNKWKADRNTTPRCVSCNWCLVNYGKQASICVLNLPRQET
ncbi:NADH:flavin oxidoreductase [Halodesulfovibrio marinisediminis]|uniref:2,4-dienoyl-CoA reductase n=1 Tax=Halodesulfovibrio marinisediminis DSM 17456 TaxID=1121457 RepID=A0A1N6EBA7_9BACT|nr:NADH:flavin oxidoreductase [Halodesulfovibrio marinisediminis]SIN80310.1 2,4-dienoyl-CoA reductase [Halodesulfovibrio marinisediminis DSM 17456]